MKTVRRWLALATLATAIGCGAHDDGSWTGPESSAPRGSESTTQAGKDGEGPMPSQGMNGNAQADKRDAFIEKGMLLDTAKARLKAFGMSAKDPMLAAEFEEGIFGGSLIVSHSMNDKDALFMSAQGMHPTELKVVSFGWILNYWNEDDKRHWYDKEGVSIDRIDLRRLTVPVKEFPFGETADKDNPTAGGSLKSDDKSLPGSSPEKRKVSPPKRLDSPVEMVVLRAADGETFGDFLADHRIGRTTADTNVATVPHEGNWYVHSAYTELDEPRLGQLLTEVKRLRVPGLSLEGPVIGVPPEAWSQLAELKDLKWLSLKHMCDEHGFSRLDSAIPHLARLTGLEHLDLSATEINDQGVSQLRDLKSLRSLNLSATSVTDAAMHTLLHFDQLRDLRLRSTDISTEGVRVIASMPSIQRLDLSMTRVNAHSIAELHAAKHLSHLDIRYNEIDDSFTASLRSLRRLETLRISGKHDSRITDAAMEHITELPNLKELSLPVAEITDLGVARLRALPQLRVLSLAYCRHVSDVGIGTLRELSSLTELDLSRTPITSDALKHLKELRSLHSLSLSSTLIDDEGLEHLSALSSLRSLALNNTEVTDIGISSLSQLQQITHLDVGLTRITDEAIATISLFDKLDTLDVHETRVTDVGLGLAVRSLPRLQSLNLSGTSITDMGLSQLKGLKHLWELHLWGCSDITVVGLSALAEVPSLSVLSCPDTATVEDRKALESRFDGKLKLIGDDD
jgi:internalin A